MRRFVLACSVPLLVGAAACGNSAPPAPPDLITIKGQLLQGSVPAVNAAIYATDHFHVAASVGDASPYPGASPAAFTDGTGRFSISGVGTSYDLAVVTPGSTDVTVIQNLTRRDPTVTLPLASNAALRSCHVTTSFAAPLPAGATVAYFLQGQTYPGIALVSLAPTDADPAHGLTASWRGGVSTSVDLWALVFLRDAATGLPTSYLGFASAYNWLIDQREIGFTISLQTTTTSSMSLNFQPPEGYSVENAHVAIDLGPGSTPVDLVDFTAPTGMVTFPVPDLPLNRLLAKSTATRGGDASQASVTTVAYPNSSADVSFTFPSVTQLVAPNDGATDVDATTPFSWNGGGVNEVTFSSATPGAPTIRVVTAASSFALEQFPAALLTPLPPNAHYTWAARRWPDFATTDAFEGAGVDLPNASSATSGARSFTVKLP